MKIKIACFFGVTLISTTLYSAYFYNDKQYSDILIANNKLVSKWVAVPESQIPAELRALVVTEVDIDGKKICLVPFKVLLFGKDGTFRYLWKENNSTTGEISGKWRVENSTLIFTLGKDYSSILKKDSELRYKIKGTQRNDTTLGYSGVSYPGVPGIIKTTNDLLKDFATIVVSMEKEKIKKIVKNSFD